MMIGFVGVDAVAEVLFHHHITFTHRLSYQSLSCDSESWEDLRVFIASVLLIYPFLVGDLVIPRRAGYHLCSLVLNAGKCALAPHSPLPAGSL